MGERILLATDGRARTDLAVEYAAAIARLTDAEIEVLTVMDERILEAVHDTSARDDLEADMRTLGDSVVNEVAARAGDVITDRVVVEGIPHRVIIESAAAADLVVLGRMTSDRADPAAVASRVIAESPTPVLSVPMDGPSPPEGAFATAMVPTDGSDYPDRALETVLDWMSSDARIHGMYVIDSAIYDLADAPRSIIGILREGGEAALADLAAVASDRSITVRRHIRRGQVEPVLLAAIDELAPDVVAVGTRGRSAGSGPLLGSTTQALLRSATVPVLAAP